MSAASANREPSIVRRSLGLMLRNPGLARTAARLAWRQKVGFAWDRRMGGGRSAIPCELKFHLTRRCNLRCVMCNQHRHSEHTADHLPWCDPKNDLPLQTWVDFLDQWVDWAGGYRPWLDLSGGEPTLYPHFAELVRQAKARRFFINLQTNGTTLGHQVDLLLDQGVEVVTVSLDGPGEYHDRIRGQKGMFDRVTEGVRALVAARRARRSPGPIIGITCTISKDNIEVLDQMVELVEGLGVDSLLLMHTSFDFADNVARHNQVLGPEMCQREGLNVINPSIPEGGWYESQISDQDLPVLAASMERARQLGRASRLRVAFAPFTMRMDLLRPYYLDLSYPFPQICEHLWKVMRIFPDGTVSPCLQFIAGNIKDTPIKEIWNGPQFIRFRQLFQDGILPGCARCCARRFTGRSKLGLAKTTS